MGIAIILFGISAALLSGLSVAWALLGGLILFWLLGLRQGFSSRRLWGMA